MKKTITIIKSVFFVILLAVTASCGSDKTNKETSEKENIETEESKTEEVFQEREYELPAQTASNSDDSEIISDKLYPIGWSKDGKFAYIIEPVDEGTGFYFITIAIQDLNSDKILWKFEYTTKDEIEDKDLKTTWEEKYAEIKEKLNEHKIEQEKKFALGKAEFDSEKNKFNLNVEANKIESPVFFGMEVLENFAVKLSASGLGTKEIFKQKEEDSRLVEALIVGQFKSPFEDRIAVLVSTEQIGYEGPPNTITFNLVGANLNKGFKK